MKAASKLPWRKSDYEIVGRIAQRAVLLATQMITEANHRTDADPADPKVGGHPAASASSVHILAALHLLVRNPQDWIAPKPHASPADHALHYLLGLFRDPTTQQWLSETDAEAVMHRLRQFPQHQEAEATPHVFQSYHAESDPDSMQFFPSGSVGIPPVVSIFMALAYRYALDHYSGRDLYIPADAHFWSLIGDSEFREGSLWEAMPEAVERQLGNVTWIVDFNRQNLDGVRMPQLPGAKSDADRIAQMAQACGWQVVQLRHGSKRLTAFEHEKGALLQRVLEEKLSDLELQLLLYKNDGALTKSVLRNKEPKLKTFLDTYDDTVIQHLLADLGGHDIAQLAKALVASKADPHTPTLIIAHTIKGWSLPCAAAPGNHSAQLSTDDVHALYRAADLPHGMAYPRYAESSAEGKWLALRRDTLRSGFEMLWAQVKRNQSRIDTSNHDYGELGINLKLVPTIHTQWAFGQLLAKLTRIGTSDDSALTDTNERQWKSVAEQLVTMAPDVGTSTGLMSVMDHRVYGPAYADNYEDHWQAKESRRPSLMPTTTPQARHIRFEIAEANSVCAAAAFGKMGQALGIPLLPVMTIYDFFIKRAYDQLYYALYWGSSFIMVGTPCGVTLSPEGAQHSWKSDIQMPNLITWEPAFARELDWILCDALKRHIHNDNKHRNGVLIRAVTRAIPQAELLSRLQAQHRYAGQSERQIWEHLRTAVLSGAYYLIDYRGYEGYEPGETVVHLFAMGAMVTEALSASDALRSRGIYANVIVVTSADLLVGHLGAHDNYHYLKNTLEISGDVALKRHTHVTTVADSITFAGRRVPIVSVCDGEVGLLDNLGSLVGVRQIALGVTKPSKSGRPVDVYRYHGIDANAIIEAAGQVLSETALEDIQLSPTAQQFVASQLTTAKDPSWRTLWPS